MMWLASPLLFILATSVLSFGCADDSPDHKPYVDPDAKVIPLEPADLRVTLDDELGIPKADSVVGRDTARHRAPDGEPAPYSIKALKITFQVKGDYSGQINHIFDDWGRKEWRRDSVVDENGSLLVNQLALTTPENTGVLYPAEKKGWRTLNRETNVYRQSADRRDKSQFEFVMDQIGAERLKDTVIAGYHTRVYRIDGGSSVQTLWIWRDFPIRIHYFLPYDDIEYRFEPVSIELNPTIAATQFEWPKGYVIDNLPNMPNTAVAPPPPPGSPIVE